MRCGAVRRSASIHSLCANLLTHSLITRYILTAAITQVTVVLTVGPEAFLEVL